MTLAAFFLISFLASIAGAICGIGGGVIIKPVMDLFQMESVAAINFLSGCTVLSMSCYSVLRSLTAGEKNVDLKSGSFLALGAAAGGVLGRQMFAALRDMSGNPDTVGFVQAVCLGLVTAGTLLYTLNKSRIRTKHTRRPAACAGIGLMLGIMSSFLGIGGGPINLVVLYYFFSMDTKTAAANSLYIILFSQTASVLSYIVTRTVPSFQPVALILMAAGGIAGGIAGRLLNRRMDDRAVDRLFLMLMVVIIGISVYNAWNYMRI